MKTFFSFLFFLGLFNICSAQKDTLINSRITFTEVVSLDSASKEILFKRAKYWMDHYYQNPKNSIQIANEQDGELRSAEGHQVKFYTRTAFINNTITILVKDNKYKYVITDFNYEDEIDAFAIENFPASWAGRRMLMERIKEHVLETVKSIKTSMEKDADITDW
jgi:Domain of unknown function (DUF4468) with TBP-like fold